MMITTQSYIEYLIWVNYVKILVLSDNGTQFTSQIFKTFTQQTSTTQHFFTPYLPESNGQVERLHRWIKERLSLISIDAGLNFIDGDDNWDEYIGLIQHAYNSTPNTMTKCSPNKIIFGSDLSYNISPIPSNTPNTTTPNQYIRFINNSRSIINNQAINNQSRYDQIRSKSYNKNRTPVHKYEVGDLVLIDVSRRMTGNKSKFTPSWHGPHEIIHIIMPDKVFKVQEVDNESHIQEINIKFIKPYKASPYMMVLNHVMDQPQIKSTNIIKYIQWRKLTLTFLK